MICATSRLKAKPSFERTAEDALRRNRRAVRGEHQCDFALRHHGHGHFDDAILPAPVTEVQSRGECVGLITRLAAQRDNAAGRQRASAKAFHDDAHLPFLNQHGAEHERPDGQQSKNGDDNQTQNG